MHISSSYKPLETRLTRRTRSEGEEPESTHPLEALLECSIRLRDLYRSARWRICDGQWEQLRMTFDAHYREQVRLVDLLVDRARTSGKVGRVFAGSFLQDPQLSWDIKICHARLWMLRTLLDAHESILAVALDGGDERRGDTWIRDLAVGQVALANQQQCQAISDLLGNRCEDPRMSTRFQWISD